ncbi:MAG: hypothetical protein PHD61_06975 [Bacteroidales bacterium]|nr:hypothetical protein [Lentimicrobiaceae bacterium]MDD5695031.1 hypothetical protein [Bacteroidales bacterium]
MYRKPEAIIALFLLILFAQGLSCDKEKPCQDFPDTYINITLLPNTLDNIPIGGYVYVSASQPSRGLIVYRPFTEEFIAFERTCPYDPYDCCLGGDITRCAALVVEASGITIIDSCCMSRYLMVDGSPFEGPSPCPLYQYLTYYDGTYLRIFN